MHIATLTIVGVGLIGGSIGLAAKQRGVARQVIGVGRRRETLDDARHRGAIDYGTLSLEEAAAAADLIVFCTPVQRIVAQVEEASRHCRRGALLTDAGSTKARIVAALNGSLPSDIRFVGSHPLAGSEKRGPEHAEANLFQDRLTIVTPTLHTDEAALVRISQFWAALGSRVMRMSPESHDAALALTSHLPHLLAAALAGVLPPELHELTATGFRDTTRIAAGDPDLWSGIFLHNRQPLLAALDRMAAQLEHFRTALTGSDEAAIGALLEQGKQVRDALGS